jgi:hypothetical protein
LIYSNRQNWVRAFDAAAQAYLDRHSPSRQLSDIPLTATACLKHGNHCAAVVYGSLLDHVRWQETEPEPLAERLLDAVRWEL